MPLSKVQREHLLVVAESWLGTPFHHAARLKGVGVDCANFLAAVYEDAGLIDSVILELPEYPPDWMSHKSEERFLAEVFRIGGQEIESPEPGDVAMFKFGHCYSHGAIVTEWPLVIHAIAPLGEVMRGDATRYPLLDKGGRPRPVKFYSML